MFRGCSLVGQKKGKLFKKANEIAKAPVAQWIEQRFPKPQVACSTHAGGAIEIGVQRKIGYAQPGFGKNRGTCAHGVLRHGFFIVDFVSIRQELSRIPSSNDRIFHYLNVKR